MAHAAQLFSGIETLDDVNEEYVWADENLDEAIKSVLRVKANGAHLNVDITAHFEYFYNTLECDNYTQNPFMMTSCYPALLYPIAHQNQGHSSPRVQTRL